MSGRKKIYFASDIHLGLYPAEKSRNIERLFVEWLREIRKDAQALYLLGDIFDYWFEYSKVVPRGFVRTLGELGAFADAGIPVHLFTGNHDVWMFDYFPSEIGATVHHKPIEITLHGKNFFLGHGDGLGPGDRGFKFLKSVFENKTLQWMYARIHPNLSMQFAHWWSRKSRYSKGIAEKWMGEDKELLVLFAKEYLKTHPVDFFIFGHRHIPMDMKLSDTSRYINLGEWIFSNSYAEFDGNELILKNYPQK